MEGTTERPAVGRAARRRSLLLALTVGLAWIALAWRLLPAYGPVWDSVIGEYPHGEAFLTAVVTGESYLEHSRGNTGARPRQPHPDFDQYRLPWHGSYPLTGFFSALSCRLLWTELGLVPALVAHNLPGVLLVGALLVVLAYVVSARFGPLAGAGAALLLVCTPRFFAHSFNNLKDAPEACLYVLAALALYGALTVGRMRTWLLAGVLVGLALAQRPNALLLPVQMLLFLLGVLALRARRRESLPWSWRGLGLALAAFGAVYFACSPAFWTEPGNLLEQLRYHLRFNLFVEQKEATVPLEAYAQGVSRHGVLLFATSTPPAILLLALVGLFHRRLRGEERLFLVLGIAVPVGRTLVPGMVNYDGVRHFLEVFPPLAVLAGLGLDACARGAWRALAPLGRPWPAAAAGVLVAALLANPVLAVARTHPNGVCYFNSFIGGLAGARERGLPDATDYWANSYWQGLAWISREAEEGAGLLVNVADHVARCAAPVRLRDDVRLVPPSPLPEGAPLYVMYVTREGLYGPLIARLDAQHEPVHEIRVQGAPILRVLRLRGEDARRAVATVDLEGEARRAAKRIELWLLERPELVPAVWLALSDPVQPDDAVVRELRSLLPPELHEDARLVVWLYRGPREAVGGILPPPRR